MLDSQMECPEAEVPAEPISQSQEGNRQYLGQMQEAVAKHSTGF